MTWSAVMDEAIWCRQQLYQQQCWEKGMKLDEAISHAERMEREHVIGTNGLALRVLLSAYNTLKAELAEVKAAVIKLTPEESERFESALETPPLVNAALKKAMDRFREFDECVASGASCVYGPYGFDNEEQCKYCGKPIEEKVA